MAQIIRWGSWRLVPSAHLLVQPRTFASGARPFMLKKELGILDNITAEAIHEEWITIGRAKAELRVL